MSVILNLIYHFPNCFKTQSFLLCAHALYHMHTHTHIYKHEQTNIHI